jgi:hypothetical protein
VQELGEGEEEDQQDQELVAHLAQELDWGYHYLKVERDLGQSLLAQVDLAQADLLFALWALVLLELFQLARHFHP